MSTSNGNDRFERESRSSREQEDNRDVILTVRVLMHGKVKLSCRWLGLASLLSIFPPFQHFESVGTEILVLSTHTVEIPYSRNSVNSSYHL